MLPMSCVTVFGTKLPIILSPKLVVPVMDSVPPTLVLLVILALFKVATPLVLTVLSVVAPVTPNVPPIVTLPVSVVLPLILAVAK